MEIKLSEELIQLVPGFKLGIIEFKNITVGDSPLLVKERLQLLQESIFFEIENKVKLQSVGVFFHPPLIVS